GGIVDGKEITMELKVGDKVIFQKYAGTEVKIEGNEYTILRQSDILAVVE
ncbi:MAG: co-chaperone GroES, partial [Romboutsia timonensis]